METELLYSLYQVLLQPVWLVIKLYCFYFVGKKLIDYYKRG